MARGGNPWLKWFGLWTVASGASFAALEAAAQAPPVPQGTQFQINTYTTGYQYRASVAAASNGDFVVVWNSDLYSGSSIQGQRYASNGSAQGAQFQINSGTSSHQANSSVAVAPNGDFVVVWESDGSAGTDTSVWSIQGRRYASNGSAQGVQFQVNTYTTGAQAQPVAAVASNGDFVVVWASLGSSGTDTSGASIQGQRYASNGSAQGAQFQINSYTSGYQSVPSAAVAPNGDFVVVWQSRGSSGTDTSYYSVQGQRYASSGSAQGTQFQINSYTPGYQIAPSVAVAPNGDFVVVWTGDVAFGPDTGPFSILGQRYTSDGSAQGAQFQVNTDTTNTQERPSVAADANGDFVVVWDSAPLGKLTTSVQGRRYASNGSAQSEQFQINSYTSGYPFAPSVAVASNGDFVVVWNTDDIQGQRYLPEPSSVASLGAMLAMLWACARRRGPVIACDAFLFGSARRSS